MIYTVSLKYKTIILFTVLLKIPFISEAGVPFEMIQQKEEGD